MLIKYIYLQFRITSRYVTFLAQREVMGPNFRTVIPHLDDVIYIVVFVWATVFIVRQ